MTSSGMLGRAANLIEKIAFRVVALDLNILMVESACAGAGCELVLRLCFRRNPWLIGLVINGISYSPGMPARPSSDGLGFFFDMPAQKRVWEGTQRDATCANACGLNAVRSNRSPIVSVTQVRVVLQYTEAKRARFPRPSLPRLDRASDCAHRAARPSSPPRTPRSAPLWRPQAGSSGRGPSA
jgi:hypothetical protein